MCVKMVENWKKTKFWPWILEKLFKTERNWENCIYPVWENKQEILENRWKYRKVAGQHRKIPEERLRTKITCAQFHKIEVLKTIGFSVKSPLSGDCKGCLPMKWQPPHPFTLMIGELWLISLFDPWSSIAARLPLVLLAIPQKHPETMIW